LQSNSFGTLSTHPTKWASPTTPPAKRNDAAGRPSSNPSTSFAPSIL
jgi:hypothetical protein